MRVVVAALALMISMAWGTVAVGSCAPPISVAENAQRADAVVYGRPVRFEGPVAPGGVGGRVAIVDVIRVLKGSVAAQITVSLGPVLEGGGVGVTSVDYRAEVGTDHTLYLKQGTRMYETNACVGDHGGGPTAEEERVLGPGGPPQGGAPRAAGTDLDPAAAVGIGVAVAIGVAAALYVLRTVRRPVASR